MPARKAASRRPVNDRAEQVHARAGQHVREQECRVVARHRIVRRPNDRGDEHADAQQVLRVRERVAIGKQDRGIPHARESMFEAVGIPAENPRAEEGSPRSPGNVLSK